MSDFIYAAKPLKKGELSDEIENIYLDEAPPVQEFHGNWGALAVSDNLYKGFQPYESDTHIIAVLGGPLLCFLDNSFLSSKDYTAGTRAILERWLSGKISWDEDLSGPFSILIIDKTSGDATCITDLMSFIPIYSFKDKDDLLLSSHVDVLARAAGQQDKLDLVSQVDFLFNGYVTYPYTFYTKIRQLAPASVHRAVMQEKEVSSVAYWVPREAKIYKSIDHASKDLRHCIKDYVHSLTKEMSLIAQFLSGGEDSRILAALLPGRPDAFVFLDSMNREGRIARKAAKIYGANFKLKTRSKTHYIDILPACTDLVGSGTEYKHVHTYGFHQDCDLNGYQGVFGGLFADSLLKGLNIRKTKRGLLKPVRKNSNVFEVKPEKNSGISSEIVKEIGKRRQRHLNRVSIIRPYSSNEWFQLWPISMNRNIGNLHGNRRLFKSYEPFLSKDVVKIAASVPQEWKLNRRLFHTFAAPLLWPSRWLLHSSGRMPYYPWYVNRIMRAIVVRIRKVIERRDQNQGPWSRWDVLHNSEQWQNAVRTYSKGFGRIEAAFEEKDVHKLLRSNILTLGQKTNLMQVLYLNQKLDFDGAAQTNYEK